MEELEVATEEEEVATEVGVDLAMKEAVAIE